MIDIGLFSKIFPKVSVSQATNGYFDTLTAYAPSFKTFRGGIYEAELCRASIHAYATHCSKLKPEVRGAAGRRLKYVLETKPNPWQTTSQWLYRTASVLETDTTAFIIPLLDATGEVIEGFFTVRPSGCEVKELNGEPYLSFTFPTGKKAIIEYSKVGVLTKFQMNDDLFGDGNSPLRATLDLIATQNQGIVEGVKNSNSIRFLAKLAQALKPKDITEERERLAADNLTNNSTGIMMFDAKYSDIKQITSTPLLIDDKQMQLIKNNVYTYFGTNENILMNDFNEEQWNAYYEGKVEPFAIQMSMVLTNMLYNPRELTFENSIILSANRLQYASNSTKLEVVTQLMDRMMLTPNEGREIFNMSPYEGGDKFMIRKEYAEADKLNEVQGVEEGKDDNEG